MKALDAIKARAEWANQVAGDLDANAFVTYRDSADDVPRLVAALEAVLELHKENVWTNGDETYTERTCSRCRVPDHLRAKTFPAPYPCEEVQAIHRALEEGKQQ